MRMNGSWANVDFHASRSWSFVTAAGTVANDVAKIPRGSGADTGTNSSARSFAPTAASVCTISGMCWWSSGLYVRRFDARSGWWVPMTGIAPLPELPVDATVCTGPVSSPAFASGYSPSALVVANQPGEATYFAFAIAARLSSGMP